LSTAVAVLALASFAPSGPLEAKTLKVQASSAPGDWAHRFMTEQWAPKLGEMTNGDLEIEVLPTKAVVPHRETIDAVFVYRQFYNPRTFTHSSAQSMDFIF
jgi:TRAP-type C4-dicarboxylate transport system substrate-binding protein